MGRSESWLDGLKRLWLEMQPNRQSAVSPTPSPVAQRPRVPAQPGPRPTRQVHTFEQPSPKAEKRPNRLVDQGPATPVGGRAAQRNSDILLIPDETPVVVPGAGSEKNQLEIETHRRRVLKNQIPTNSAHAQGGIRKSLHQGHPIQAVGDATLDHLQQHVQRYIDSD